MARTLAANQARFTFTVGDRPFSVVSFEAREALSQLYIVKLELVSKDSVPFAQVMGRPALLTIESGQEDRHFHGLVIAFGRKSGQGTHPGWQHYQAELQPQVALLDQRKDCRIFQHKSVPQIVAQVLSETGLPGDMYRFNLRHRYRPRTYCVQYRESHLNFIRRLLVHEGIFFYFEHRRDNHCLVFGDSPVNYRPIDGQDRVPYRPARGLLPEFETVHDFIDGGTITSGQFVQRDYDFLRPDLDLTCCQQDADSDKLCVYDYPGAYSDPEEGQRLAKVRLQQLTVHKDIAQGRSTVARFTPGRTFTLTEPAFSSNENRPFLLEALTHRGEQPQVLEQSADSSRPTRYDNTFFAIPATVCFQPGGHDLHQPIIRRLQTAIVTGPRGEEIYTDKYGRVKVQFHWDRRGRFDENSSCWIRVTQMWAGNGWGALFTPRIGQEVIVKYMEGNPDRPYIAGRLYHGDNRPPYELPANKTVSTIKTRSTPGGDGFNEIRMEDKKGAEQLFVHAEKDLHQRIKNDQRITIGRNGHNITKNNQYIQIDGSRHRTVKGDSRGQVNGDAYLTVDGDLQRKVEGHHGLKAGQRIDISALKSIVLEAGASLTLKAGPSFIRFDDSGISVGGPRINLNSGGTARSFRGVYTLTPRPPLEPATGSPGHLETHPAAAFEPKPQPTPEPAPEPTPIKKATAPRQPLEKLALEIAGTKRAAVAGNLYAASPGGMKKLHDCNGIADDHRRQVFIKGLPADSYRLYYDLGPLTIPLDLGNPLPTCPEPAAGKQWPTILVPMVPRAYTSVHLQRTPDNADYVRQGWIYIYLNGYLWRELSSDGKGNFSDVDLEKHKGADTRPAAVSSGDNILLPFQVNGRRPKLEICYSEIQWSWAQVTALGGMDPADIRLEKGPPVQPCHDPAKAANYRKQRLQPLDLSSYPGFDLSEGIVGSTDQKSADGTPYLRTDLAALQGEHLPVVYLHDALGIAQNCADGLIYLQAELLKVLKEVQHLETTEDAALQALNPDQKRYYFNLAAVTYRTFFDTGKNNDTLADAAEHMSEFYLKTCLAVERRKQIRTQFREIKQGYVNFLQDKNLKGEPLKSRHPDFVGVNAAILDYANLADHRYILQWDKMNNLIGSLGIDPCVFDSHLDKASEVAAQWPTPAKDPGIAYYNSLGRPDHPLHAALFPGKEQVDTTVPMSASLAGLTPELPDGSGDFRPMAYALAVNSKNPPKPPGAQIANSATEMANEFFRLMVSHENRMAKNSTTSSLTGPAARLQYAGKEPQLDGLKIGPSSSTTSDEAPIMPQLDELTGPKYAKGPVVLRNAVGKEVGRMAAEELSRFKGIPNISSADIESLCRNNQLVATLPKKKLAEMRIKGASTCFALFAAWNAVLAAREVVSRGDIESAIKMIAADAAFIKALTNAASALYGNEKNLAKALPKLGKGGQIYSDFLTRQVKIGEVNLTYFRAFSIGVTAAGALMEAWSCRERIGVGDTNSSVFYGAAATAGLALTGAEAIEAGLLGKAAALAVTDPLLLALAVVTIALSLIAFLVKDSEYELWAKQGPFAKNRADRMTETLEGKDYFEAYIKLIGLFHQPKMQLAYRHSLNELWADVSVPGFNVGKYLLKVNATAEIAYPADAKGQVKIEPYAIEPLFADAAKTVLKGYRYLYHYSDPFPQSVGFRARARYDLGEGIILPPPKFAPDQFGALSFDPVKIKKQDANQGWLVKIKWLLYDGAKKSKVATPIF